MLAQTGSPVPQLHPPTKKEEKRRRIRDWVRGRDGRRKRRRRERR